jgi:hypothetical protein
MMNLVKYGVDPDFVIPPHPTEAERKEDKLFEVKWKADYDDYLKERKLYVTRRRLKSSELFWDSVPRWYVMS